MTISGGKKSSSFSSHLKFIDSTRLESFKSSQIESFFESSHNSFHPYPTLFGNLDPGWCKDGLMPSNTAIYKFVSQSPPNAAGSLSFSPYTCTEPSRHLTLTNLARWTRWKNCRTGRWGLFLGGWHICRWLQQRSWQSVIYCHVDSLRMTMMEA